MIDPHDDHEELRPYGEATHVPDHVLNGSHRNQSLTTDGQGYLVVTDPANENTCLSCDQAIPAHRTKCRYCLTNQVEPLDAEASDPAREWDFLHLIFAVIEASNYYAAVAKGSAACTLLVDRTDDPIGNCQLVYDFEEPPSTFLTDRWGDLPSASRVNTEVGKRLLEQARARTTWEEDADTGGNHATYLYAETGDGIRSRDQLATLQSTAEDPIWLVPAIALQPVLPTGEPSEPAEQQSHRSPSRHETLNCDHCNEETAHIFAGYNAVPDPTVPDTPIWECDRCETPRHGPALSEATSGFNQQMNRRLRGVLVNQ